MPKRHTPEDIERGLTALAVAGNSLTAAEMTGFNDRTIRKWREQHADRFALIESGRAVLIDQACIEEFRNIVLTAATGTLEAVDLTRTDLQHDKTLPQRAGKLLADIQAASTEDERKALMHELGTLTRRIKDSSATAKNLATTFAITADKIALMEGRPTSITEHRTSDDVMRGLAAAGFVDSTAVTDDDETARQSAF